MWILFGLGAVVLFLATRSSSTSPPPPLGSGPKPEPNPNDIVSFPIPGVPGTQGPPPSLPLSNGWRPVSTLDQLPSTTSLATGEAVKILIQEGVRDRTDNTEMAYVKAIVQSRAANGVDYDLRLASATPIKAIQLTKPLPPLGTLFTAVPPRFITSRMPLF